MRYLMSLLLVGCGGDDGQAFQCHAPMHTMYSCAPVPAGSVGCHGGPVWFKGAPDQHDGGALQDDPDAVFPVGCRATIPDCLTFENGRRFYCGSDGTVAGWGEEL